MDNFSEYPVDMRGLYFLLRDGVIVYIGSASNHGKFSNVWRRVTEHRRRGEKNFDSFRVFDMSFNTPEEIREEEVHLIKKHVPEYNIQHAQFVCLDRGDYAADFLPDEQETN